MAQLVRSFLEPFGEVVEKETHTLRLVTPMRIKCLDGGVVRRVGSEQLFHFA